MNTNQILDDIERRAKAAGMDKKNLCERAGIDVSTFNRWRAGTHSPNVRNLEKLNASIQDAEDLIAQAS